MKTYLFTWNPEKWDWEKLDEACAKVTRRGFVDEPWSCGVSRKPRADDRAFLLRQGKQHPGIVASGHILSKQPYEDDHWDGSARTALYVKVRWDTLLHPDRQPILPRSSLNTGKLGGVHWDTQSSGITISAEPAAELEEVWRNFLATHGYSPVRLATEVTTPERFWEGALRRITVNAYERDPKARQACIAHFGTACRVCGLDFGDVFGKLGQGYIHVHHTRPLSEIGEGYAVDPLKDLIPVCPNCHAMLHQKSPPLTAQKKLCT